MLLEKEPTVTTAVKVCLPDLTLECLAETTSYLVSTYPNIRGKDFVRQIIGPSKKSLAIGTLPTLAVLSNPSLRPHGKPIARPKNLICYFCGEKGHRSSDCDCDSIVSRPDGAPETHTTNYITMKGATKSHTWHWCESCERWQGHGTKEDDEGRVLGKRKRQSPSMDADRD